MKQHNYAFQNADTRPRLQSRTQNICFVISISAVILKRMVKIKNQVMSLSAPRPFFAPHEWDIHGIPRESIAQLIYPMPVNMAT